MADNQDDARTSDHAVAVEPSQRDQRAGKGTSEDHAERADASSPLGAIHHIELWVADLDRAAATWGWLLTEMGYTVFQDWPGGRSWRSGQSYIVLEQSPARTASRHDRLRPGMNHLAFHVPSRHLVDKLTGESLLNGWKLMFAESHPHAGGPQHYAAYLENADGFEVELVADDEQGSSLHDSAS